VRERQKIEKYATPVSENIVWNATATKNYDSDSVHKEWQLRVWKK
jgi:hypothetical protein